MSYDQTRAVIPARSTFLSLFAMVGVVAGPASAAETLFFEGPGLTPVFSVPTASPVTVPSGFKVGGVVVHLTGLQTASCGDLNVTLRHVPTNTFVPLFQNIVSVDSSDFNGDYSFDEYAAKLIWWEAVEKGPTEALAPGVYQPTESTPKPQPLSAAFFGKDAGGQWELTMFDNVPGNDATLASWTLELKVIGPAAPILYVDDDALDGGDGLSWGTAHTSLQAALDAAAASPGVVGEIRVAQGTYYPQKWGAILSPPFKTFRMVEGASLLGGFAGVGAPDPDARDPEAYPTILSGDVDQNDGPDFTNYDANAQNIVTAEYGNPWTLPTSLDGFVITHSAKHGVRIFVVEPTIRNCVFTECQGGLHVHSKSNVEDCVFTNNKVFKWGAGLLLESLAGGNQIRRCRFENNFAQFNDGLGAAIYADAPAVIVDCSFIGNVSEGTNIAGGALYAERVTAIVNCFFAGNSSRGPGGALASLPEPGKPTRIANCIFSGNTCGIGYPQTTTGGALHGSGVVQNCVFHGNSSSGNGGAVAVLQGGALELRNSLLWANESESGSGDLEHLWIGGTITISRCSVEGWSGTIPGVENNALDPLFADPDGADELIGTADDDFRLMFSSAAIDSGGTQDLPADVADLDGDFDITEPISRDFDGNIRVFDDPVVANVGTGGVIDRGAFEFGAPANEPGYFTGKIDGNWNNAANWAGGQVPDESTSVLISSAVELVGAGSAGVIGLLPGGELTVTGSLGAQSITVNAGSALVLGAESASLTVEHLTITSGGALIWSGGAITVEGGTFSTFGPLNLGCVGLAASLHLLDGAVLDAPTLTICDAGTLTGEGEVLAAVTNGGAVHCGDPAGTLYIANSYSQQSGGVLEFEIFGGQIDTLQVAESAELTGELRIMSGRTLPSSLVPIEFIGAGSVDGSFVTVLLPQTEAGYTPTLLYTPTSAAISIVPPGPRLYVAADGSASGSGASWATATSSLEAAIDAANLSTGAVTEIWVKAGIYKPHVPDPGVPVQEYRDETFSLPGDFALLGGFAGHEESADERNIQANPTILDGDLLGNDSGGATNLADNVSHVIRIGADVENVIVDGVTVRGGNGASQFSDYGGGGLFVEGDCEIRSTRFQSNFTFYGGAAVTVIEANVLLKDCQFIDNTDLSDNEIGGGAMQVFNAHCTLENCAFVGNSSQDFGGAIYAHSSQLSFTECIFDQSFGSPGAGLFAELCSLTIADSTFTGNTANISAKMGGGAFLRECEGEILGCTFFGNQANLGGGLTLQHSSRLTITGCEFAENIAAQSGGGLHILECSPLLLDCTFMDNAATVRGGGVYANSDLGSTANPGIVNCVFQSNSVQGSETSWGGGLCIIHGVPSQGVGPVIEDSLFLSNISSVGGGGLYTQTATTTLLNGEFSGNSAPEGPAALNTGIGGVLLGYWSGALDEEVTSHSTLAVDGGTNSFAPTYGICTSSIRLLDRGPEYSDQPALVLDVGGLVPGALHDQVDAGDGGHWLDGVLGVTFENNYEPEPGDSFELLRGGFIKGSFQVAELPPAPNFSVLTLDYSDEALTLRVTAPKSILSFTEPELQTLPLVPSAMTAADLDNDGDTDVALALSNGASNGAVRILRNLGVSPRGEWLGFQLLDQTLNIKVNPVAITTGLFNNDASLDLAVAHGGTSQVSVMMNTGTGSAAFANPVHIGVPGTAGSIAAGPINTGASVDLAVTLAGSDSVRLLLNNGAGLFTSQQSVTTHESPKAVAVADLQGDGHTDLVTICTGNAVKPPRIAVHLGSGAGWALPTLYPLGSVPNGLLVKDLNEDGLPEIFATSTGTGTASVLMQSAALPGYFLTGVSQGIGSNPGSPIAADFDQDGDVDVGAVVEAAPGVRVVRVIRNDLNDSATVAFTSVFDLATAGTTSLVAVGNLNMDALPDLVAANITSDGVAGNGPSAASMLNVTGPFMAADLNGDGTVDGGDLGLLLGAWDTDDQAADLNDDGTVDGADLGLLLAAWSA